MTLYVDQSWSFELSLFIVRFTTPLSSQIVLRVQIGQVFRAYHIWCETSLKGKVLSLDQSVYRPTLYISYNFILDFFCLSIRCNHVSSVLILLNCGVEKNIWILSELRLNCPIISACSYIYLSNRPCLASQLIISIPNNITLQSCQLT